MSRPTKQLVSESFADVEAEEAKKFMDITLESWREISKDLIRAVVLIFILVAIFELLATAKSASSVSLGGLSFSNTSLLQIFLPALIAYLFYDTYQMSDLFLYRGRLYNALLEKYQPNLAKSKIMAISLPQLRGPWPFSAGRPFGNDQTNIDKLDRFVVMIVVIVTFVIVPIAFESQAYYLLIHKYGLEDIYTWVSITFASFFIIAFVIRLIMDIQEGVRSQFPS